LLLQRAHCLLTLGRIAEARMAALTAQRHAGADARLLDAIGTLLSRASDQRAALAAYDAAVGLAPDQPHLLFNRAAARRFVGDLAGAERDYDRVVELKPDDFEAYRNRSELRPQTAKHNHVGELRSRLAGVGSDWRGEVELRYALAKEYEDLGEYESSFRELERGARARREHLRYDLAIDLATVEWIKQAFPPPPLPAPTTATGAESATAAGPIFIVGLPRSGSTLVERILGRHPSTIAAGELPNFALVLTAAVQKVAGGTRLDRRAMVQHSARVDFPALGLAYLQSVRAAGITSARFTDKMPLNYLYCGLIARALPAARIVHVHRAPMAACFAIYKMLFKDGYPFSYDLSELARYYAGYRRLMAHWDTTLPGRVHALSYEALVADQIGETRRLLAFCGLAWEEACAHFEDDPSPTTTASAAQVRRPLYDTAVSQWRHYEKQLAPLSAALSAAGVRADE
jgi:tetratricopeptide (TPR) repeat protein